MAGRLARLIDRWHLGRVERRWSGLLAAATAGDLTALRPLRGEARALRRQVDAMLLVAEGRLAQPVLGAGLPRTPLGTDWAWRPDLWRGPLSSPGTIATGPRSQISDDLSLYHDCPLGEVALRQRRNRQDADRAPYGLALDVFGFQGSFLSLALKFPEPAITGLTARHLIEVQALLDCDTALPGFARLNLRHGPNTAQVVSALPLSQTGPTMAAFDLAYAGLDQRPIEAAWLDLIFNDPAMTRITLRDVVVSRRPRAEA